MISKYSRLMGLGICSGLIFSASGSNPGITENEKPNIIIILADDLGYGDLGGYYGGNAKTPHINRLAQEGLTFTDFHTNGPMCTPTRASLLTGRYSQRLGVEAAQQSVMELPENENEITMADYLGEIGYATGIIGKWHLGSPPEGNPVNFGFDKFTGYHGGCLDYFTKYDRWGVKDWWHNEELVYEDGYVTDLITEHSIQYIKDHKDDPFFLFVSHLAIHFPWQGPEDGNLETRRKGEDFTSNYPGPQSKLGPHQPEQVPSVLHSMVEELDVSVGRIMETLHEQGLDRNTLVIFASDNGGYITYPVILNDEDAALIPGFQAGITEPIWPNVGSNGPLRGQKTQIYEGGHRVPAIAWWPGKIPALSVSDQTIMTMDILPTVLDILNINIPPEDSPNFIDGISILPLLLKGETITPRTLFWRIHNRKAVRQGPWKLVIRGDSVELYNLDHDIGETTNLKAEYPKLVNELINKLAYWENSVDY